MKKYILPLLTLLLVVLGGAMPWLAGRMQDERMGTMQEWFDLNAVNLTLRQDVGVGPALKVVSGETYAVLPWEEETQLSEQDAFSAAVEAIGQMAQYDLISAREAVLLEKRSCDWAEPSLIVAEDGSSALVWNCYWEDPYVSVTVDDASGKVVQFLIDSPLLSPKQEEVTVRERTSKWDAFFQEYYEIDPAENEALNELKLKIYEDYTAFNF